MRMSLQTSQRSSVVVAPHWFLSSLCIDSGPVAWSHRLQLVEGSTSVTVLYETLWEKIAAFDSSPSLTSHGQNPPAPLEIGNHRESHSSLEPLPSHPTSANFGKSTRKVSHVMLPASTIARFVTPSISRSWTNTVHVMMHATQSSIGLLALSENRSLLRPVLRLSTDRSASRLCLNQDGRFSGSYASIVGPARQMSSRPKPRRYAVDRSTLFGSQCLICSPLKDVPPRLRLPSTLRARINYRSGRCC
jgi:hypothetical protein